MKTEIHNPSNATDAAEASEESAARGPGRPSRRTPELEAAIFECLELGLTIAETCDICGVSETQFRTWRQHYPDFAAMVRRGQAEAVRTHLAIIREAAGKRWQAAAWWLERRCPERWGRTQSQTISGHRLNERKADGEEMEELPDLLTYYNSVSRAGSNGKAGPAASESKPGISVPAGVPESAAGLEDEREDLPGGAGNEPGSDVRRPGGENRRVRSARKTPTVFIGGARSGKAAEYDEDDSSTHVQNGCRLSEVTFIHEGQLRHLKVFASPAAPIDRLEAEAVRLLRTGNRAASIALAAQEGASKRQEPLKVSSYGTNGNYQN